MGENVKILIIEESPGDVYLVEEQLEEFANFSYEINNVGTLIEALSVLKKLPFDLILLDLVLPDSCGVNTFFRIHNEHPLIPLIVLTERSDEEIGAYAVKNGAQDFFVKGQMEGRLLECINACSI